ncbi:MAG: winged helix DNA-binding domain-containing protein [Acidobacteriota bacterium]
MPPTPIDMVAQRLRNQRLARSAFRKPEDVVSWLGAVQAQDFAGAKWGVALRARGVTDDDVDRACDEGRILRTHVMRPTWHFIVPRDIRWMLALTAPRVHSASKSWYRVLELDERIFLRSRKVLERALEGGASLTRAGMVPILAAAGITATGPRLAGLMFHAELEGVICSGPRRGKQSTYALLEERVAPVPALTREEALAELTRRYFASHGPATLRDFGWWSGLAMRDVRSAVESAGAALQRIVQADLTYWFVPLRTAAPVPSPWGLLLPNYDEYLIAHKDRGHVVDPATPAPATLQDYPHHLVIDGRLRGSWKRAIGTRAGVIAVRAYRPLTKPERRAVEAEVQRYSRFLNLPVTASET